MNILIFSWRGPGHPNSGGAEISTHEHAKGWVKAGHNVTLFTSYYPGAKREQKLDGINIIRRGRQVFGVQSEAFKWYLFENNQKFDLVVDEFHGIPFFTPLYVRSKKLAFIHEVTKEVWRLNHWPKPLNLLPAIIGTLFEPLIFRLFYLSMSFMTVSESTKKDLITWGIPKKNITVVYNGVNIPKIHKLPLKEKIRTAIFLGAISKDKGIEDALNIFSFINKKEKDWQFWVVGKSDSVYLLKLKKLSKKLGLSHKIKFWGYVSEDKKFELLSRAHVLINPSIREGWGLVVIEAAAIGTPAVAFDVPGLRDSIINGNTGIINKQHSVDSIASEIIDLLRDEIRYQRMITGAVKWSKRFSWEKSIIESLDLINKIMKNSNY